MFKLKSATVHYGMSRYPLNGLPERFNELSSLEDLNLAALKEAVGRLTSFPREFTARLIPEQRFEFDSGPLVIREHIYASANGYGLVWERV